MRKNNPKFKVSELMKVASTRTLKIKRSKACKTAIASDADED